MPTTRERLLDAAIDLLGTRGSRALTHRAVDEAAGLPAGSSSNYFRTRDALLSGIAERLEERDHLDWAALSRVPAPGTVDQLIETMAAFVRHAVTTDRTRTLARYTLFLDARADGPHESVLRGRQRLTAWAGELVRGAGRDESAAALLVDYLDGVTLRAAVSGADGFDPKPDLERIVRALLG
ncbi:TetR/AcrR family transcriptional regulator [Nocardia higoensis]|uniref:TetR/AcrR family transcriptional regulator n=1 Tax=Nocardia higoensis TaxID=228599 RepID=UPI0002FEF16A|nr:TetR/AcrR family transcriptional regulator [Nocardia higoensis]